MPTEEPFPPFRWATRYDLIGLALAAIVAVLLVLVGAPWYWVLLAACVVTRLTSALLSKRAGANEPTIWQRIDRKRRR